VISVNSTGSFKILLMRYQLWLAYGRRASASHCRARLIRDINTLFQIP